MKKDIYIIVNSKNDYVYVGQSVNAKQRWAGHCSNAKTGTKFSLIDKAMNEIGVEFFSYRVIERVENYNEREKYWINYYHSLHPTGYNWCAGGEGITNGLCAANSLIRDERLLMSIMNDIKNTTLPLHIIGERYSLNKRIITAINRGTAYHNDLYTYPLRARSNDKDYSAVIDSILKDLLDSSLSLRQIMKKYEISKYVLYSINNGSRYPHDNITYPIREVSTKF